MSFAVASDGARLFYETIGQGEPLLLVAGRNSDHHLWNLARRDFVRHYRVIVYDPRGTGQSDKPESPPYTTRLLARDAIAILDGLEIPRAHVYGVSMGGAVGQWLGIDYPTRVQTLVLACSNAGRSHGVRPSPETRAIMADRNAGSQAVGLMFSKPSWVRLLQFFFSMRESRQHPLPAYAERLQADASEQHDAWDLLPTITAPTLVIQGSDDPVCPSRNAELLAGQIPGAELRLIPDGRHMFFIEFRKHVNRLILDFLAQHSMSRTGESGPSTGQKGLTSKVVNRKP